MRRFLALVLALVVAACAAPVPVIAPDPTPEAAVGPEFGALILTGSEILVQAARTPSAAIPSGATPSVAARGIERINGVFRGGADGVVLFSASTADSTLLLRTRHGRVVGVHATSGEAVYTVAWSPDGSQAAFGHYRPRGEASQGRPNMGAGDILVFDGESATTVGCSASRAVLGWAPDGKLLVRNTDNLYLIERDGCGTVATIDARRMHRLTVSPDVSRLVFVHRELEFDRATRAYVADSTFRMTDLAGENARTVVSFKYRPQGFAWREDGSELAFDVIDPNMPGARAISIFDLNTGTAAYLHPPTSAESREFGPAWAPGGGRMAYSQGGGDRSTIAVRTFANPFPVVVPDSEGADLLGWLDEHTLVLRDPDGVFRVVDLAEGNSQRITGADAVIEAWRLR